MEGVVRVAIEAISRQANKNTLQTLLQSTAFPQPAGQKVCMRVSLQPALSANTTIGTKDRSTAFQASTKSFREREQKENRERQREKDRKQEKQKEKKKANQKKKKETKNRERNKRDKKKKKKIEKKNKKK